MPAISKSQQRLMAMAYEVKKYQSSGGSRGMDPKDIDVEYRSEVEELASSMSMEKLKDFAQTKHKGIPNRVKESSLTGFFSAGPFPQFDEYWFNASGGQSSAERDKRDPLIKKFMDFIDGKKIKKKDYMKQIQEDAGGFAGVATPSNTPGMGNVAPPSPGEVGSGDTFNGEEDDVNQRIGIMSYEDYKKWIEKRKRRKRD